MDINRAKQTYDLKVLLDRAQDYAGNDGVELLFYLAEHHLTPLAVQAPRIHRAVLSLYGRYRQNLLYTGTYFHLRNTNRSMMVRILVKLAGMLDRGEIGFAGIANIELYWPTNNDRILGRQVEKVNPLWIRS